MRRSISRLVVMLLAACAPPGASPSDGSIAADAGASTAVATESLLASGDICIVYPRERRFPTWVFQDTWVRVIPYAPGSHRISLQAGRRHLYAPGSADICFWLETTSYGREQKRPDKVPLQGEVRFWVLPEEVNGWFMPSPPAPEGARATGGSTTVLRQGPCEDAPDSQ